MQERRNSISYALELRLSCTNPSIFWNAQNYVLPHKTWSGKYHIEKKSTLYDILFSESQYDYIFKNVFPALYETVN